LPAFLTSVITCYLLDNIVMAFRTSYFPRPHQTSPRRIWRGYDETSRSDCPDHFRNELSSRFFHIYPYFWVTPASELRRLRVIQFRAGDEPHCLLITDNQPPPINQRGRCATASRRPQQACPRP